ncbi:prepilin-type N-terminal cleavage/methylation domain-containing protein [Synechococcus sp. PCC 7502]|uniref:type IV pilin-like G/H family protein n=1 Tax=Synechococcus sp. PCC 7502 TaxID=1173263 RepID=UPI00029FD912|nr:type IV pilin-like G/H family protein [Synechococcus sp. PCC 7502]AFY73053.1 prepilin-type N-terminal cleavage/methylation domain-containing protein [Synechococcus sp. PCC 7502]
MTKLLTFVYQGKKVVTEFNRKLLQTNFNKKDSEIGFTLIELLVVIIIIGILAAIALPAFLNQANKARQSEAKTYVGEINRAQQVYYLEKQEFAPNFPSLNVGINQNTPNYAYGVNRLTYGKGVPNQQVYGFGLPNGGTNAVPGSATNPDTINFAALGAPIKAYAGVVIVANLFGATDSAILSVLCEQNVAGVDYPSSATDFNYTAFVNTSTTSGPTCITSGSTGWSPIN